MVFESKLLPFCNSMQIYVFGSTLKLGQWKTQGALKLHYAGESVWQADCLMQKDDFPLKYPSSCCNFASYHPVFDFNFSFVASVPLTAISHTDMVNLTRPGNFQ